MSEDTRQKNKKHRKIFFIWFFSGLSVLAIGLGVVLPFVLTSNDKPHAEGIYEVSGKKVLGFTPEVLEDPSLIDGITEMKFNSGYTLEWNAFYGGGAIFPQEQEKMNACLSHFTSINLTGISLEVNPWIPLNSTFYGATFASLQTLNLSSMILGSSTFAYTTFSVLQTLNLSSSTVDYETFCAATFTTLQSLNLSSTILGGNTFDAVVFPSLTSLTLPSTLGFSTFHQATFPSSLATLNIPYSSSEDIPSDCFSDVDWNKTSRNTNITIHIPTSASTSNWDDWANIRFNNYYAVNNDLS